MKREIMPSAIKNALMDLGYSEFSASVITAQYLKAPDNPRAWGTEERTRADVMKIVGGRTDKPTTKKIQDFIENLHDLMTYPGAWEEYRADTIRTMKKMINRFVEPYEEGKNGND